MNPNETIKMIKNALTESAELKQRIAETMAEKIAETAKVVTTVLKNDGKILFCGNGGSAADSQHLATELVVRLTGETDRPALPGIALTTDSSLLTACSNDFGFEKIFSRQIEALGRKGDILFAISTSGNSPNIINGINSAKKIGMVTIGLTGNDGGKLSSLADYSLVVPSNDTQRIQEAHIAIGHIIIQLVEKRLFR